MADIKGATKWVVGATLTLFLSLCLVGWYGLRVLKAQQLRANYIHKFEKTDVREILILKASDGHVRILSFGTVWNSAPSADQQKFK